MHILQERLRDASAHSSPSVLPPALCSPSCLSDCNRSCVSGLQTRQCVIPHLPPSLLLLLGLQRSDGSSDEMELCLNSRQKDITPWSLLSLVLRVVGINVAMPQAQSIKVTR
ncbi:hypothetical protein PBY51_022099 [Eleginops maclovinus]|uniref:Uncharacterized protein n=1 Tax=Eleginops maclovinus TaxID=56733 RepID=A0AAN8AMP7_ELEMC|nr:hypothetical protein PBY51_022099 [Eleginops maclovinus]